MLGSITFMAEFQLHLFALIAKPAWDSNLEPFKKGANFDNLKLSELTTRPIPAAIQEE